MKRVKEEAVRRERFNLSLTTEDPLWEGDELDGRPACTADALTHIQEYIRTAYWLTANPLPHLRNYFPGFAWKYHAPLEVAEFVKIVEESDYVLSVIGDWGQVVTAREIDRKLAPRKLIFVENREMNRFGWPVKESRMCGARFIGYSDGKLGQDVTVI